MSTVQDAAQDAVQTDVIPAEAVAVLERFGLVAVLIEDRGHWSIFPIGSMTADSLVDFWPESIAKDGTVGMFLVNGKKRKQRGGIWAAVATLITNRVPMCRWCSSELFRIGHRAVCSGCWCKSAQLIQKTNSTMYWFLDGNFYKFQAITPRLGE